MECTNKQVLDSESGKKRVGLSLNIPSGPTDFSSNHGGKGLLHSHGPSRDGSSSRGFLHGPSFQNQIPTPDDRSSLLESGLSATRDSTVVPENGRLSTYIATLAWKRCVSLPVTRGSKFSPSICSPTREMACTEQDTSRKRPSPANVSRSLSVPIRNVVIMRSGSFPTPRECAQIDISEGSQINPAHLEDGDEEIPEEDAVCRVCLDGLCEGGSSLKLQCSCRGALSLMHEECAVKWFSIKGNKTCDVCGQEILNLPVIFFRMQSSIQRDNRQPRISQSSNSQLTRAWQDVVVLVFISTICYFFFLEQLLVAEMKYQAIVIAAPFSFSLGLVSSIFAVVLACKEYVWAYSAFQFALVVTFLHLFYSMLHVRAVIAVLLAAFLGCGIALGVNSLFLLIFARRFQFVQARGNSNAV